MGMRILHTSDWHLGRSFGDARLLDEQAKFVDWMVELTEAEQVDLVVVSGDLFDRSVPPADAVVLLSETIRRLRSVGAEVVAIAGNHDSSDRIGSYDGLVDAGGVIMRGGYSSASRVAVRQFSDGPLAIVATPFLEPLMAPPAVVAAVNAGKDPVAERSPRISHEMVVANVLEDARAALPRGTRSIVLSHAFVAGAEPSDSERDLAVGDSGLVSSSHYEGFDYVALGHLHRPQIVAGRDNMRYSGSPLPYSFSEDHQKSVVIVDMDKAGTTAVTKVPIGVGRGVRTLRGTFQELMSGPQITEPWVRVELTDLAVIPDAHRSLRRHFPHLVEIARVGRAQLPTVRLTADQLKVRRPDELARDFWAEINNSETTDEVASILDAAVAEAGRYEEGAA